MTLFDRWLLTRKAFRMTDRLSVLNIQGWIFTSLEPQVLKEAELLSKILRFRRISCSYRRSCGLGGFHALVEDLAV